MKQEINTALNAYIVAARAFSCTSTFNAIFKEMYADDADHVEKALTAYNKNDDLVALRKELRTLDDDGFKQVLAYLKKHSHTVARNALK